MKRALAALAVLAAAAALLVREFQGEAGEPEPEMAGPGYLPRGAPLTAPEGPAPLPGFRRIDFHELSAYDYDPEADNIPDEIRSLDGSSVELKGVMYYGVEDPARVTDFHLMPNHYVCCFGTPRMNEVVRVTLRPGLTTRYVLDYYLVRGTIEVGAARDAAGRVLHLYRIREAEARILR
jgi:hypothetical protein